MNSKHSTVRIVIHQLRSIAAHVREIYAYSYGPLVGRLTPLESRAVSRRNTR